MYSVSLVLFLSYIIISIFANSNAIFYVPNAIWCKTAKHNVGSKREQILINRESWLSTSRKDMLTLELPHQSNWLVLQYYFKIPTSCYIFSRNDVMTFATITKRIIQWILFYFLCIQARNNFVSRLFIPIPVKVTGTCQSVKGSCNLFMEPQLTGFLVLIMVLDGLIIPKMYYITFLL